ncbi:DNA-3-methyladenine glycosylase [Pituophis catenifer annectens]|uniref:DNA-3-methyladenine glycosylase n=1 Tax=Pituophis catenifer annectens TaxID=94852 RepID=UPI0039926552
MSPSGVPRLQPAASHNAQPGPGSSLSFPGKNAKPPLGGAEELPGPFRRSASPLSSASRFYRPDAAQPAAMFDAPRPLHTEAARKPGSGSSARLGAAYFDQPCIPLAKALLGQILVRKLPDGRELRGRIVETEAYLGGEDTASHSRGGRRTLRNAAMFMRPGTLYVYQIYGIYYCMNVSSQGEGAAVLLRSLEPLQGLEAMRELRLVRQRKAPARPLKDWHLCNGPSKLCQALAIDRSFDQQDMSCNSSMWLEPGLEASRDQVPICAPRIGISGEWAQKPLRFYLQGNKCVSVIDKNTEGKLPCDAITEKCV